ncbi:MAG TPA: NYN domain-containing protein [Clostridiaceae bacterium]|nr:NYN domain-containing protein [Clostridiaceae bacterium]
MIEEKRFAVLIDADNVSAKYIKYILDEIANYGVATYKRIYGDWTKPNVASWKDILLENSVTPVQQYGYTVGKNATDSAMIIDAMDILYSGNVDGYCIVSSDSDFTKLSSRLRESGMLVVGMGERKTPKPFIASCNQFKYLDVIYEAEKKSMELERQKMETERQRLEKERQKSAPPTVPAVSTVTRKQEAKTEVVSENGKAPSTSTDSSESGKSMTDINVIKMAIIKMMNESDAEDQSMNMGEIGNRLVKRYPDFDVRNYGDTKLSKFLKKFDFLDINTKGKGTSMWVTLKSDVKEEPVEEVVPAPPVKRKRVYKKKRVVKPPEEE